ncbi:hypothetical protein ACFPK9_02035 [Rubritalea spongiae]|uniref:DUF3300 domain-containing protein n=1 Tax=Rubritalea spongiae TaxID=430797 RepID=A0ABW5E3G3_9BACT
MLHSRIICSLLCLSFCTTLTQCSRTEYVTTIVQSASDGLDLKAVTDLATKSKSAEEFEKKLNTPNNKVNNLDLNEDDKVDFIKVTEIVTDSQRALSLTTEVAPGEEQELCTIQFEKDGDAANVETRGNSQVYGNNHYYHHHTGIGEILLWSYLWNAHSPYHSSWGWNRYPSYHNSYSPRSYDQYRGFHKNASYSSNIKQNNYSSISKPVKSPNFNKSAQSIKAPLKNPTTSQRTFQARNPSRTVRSGGFGSARSGFSSSSRSGSSFGGGK